MSIGRTSLLATLIAAASVAGPLQAQQTDIIRGLVTSEDGRTIENAVIGATSIPNNVSKNTKADKNGRFNIAFPNGEGDYWISVSMIGFSPRRFELKRVADEEILIADVKLARMTPVLDAVKVIADRARPNRNDPGDITGTEKSVGNAAVDVTQAGNIAAMAAALPGVQLIPGADGNPDQFSVFGLGGDQNSSTLNGLGFGGGDIPRDASTRTSLGTNPWDVARGGFSGGQFSVRTQSGSNFSSRGLSGFLNAPPLEWTDRAGRSAGAEFTSFSLGAATSGPVAEDRTFYSAGYQLDRRFSDQQNLTSADQLALRTAGVARDSVTRLNSILGSAGVPVAVSGLPTARVNDRGSFLAALDFSPPASTSGQALNITASGSFNRLSSPFSQVTALPTIDARRTSWVGSLQGRHTTYLGAGILTESSLGVSRTRTYTEPYLVLPTGLVRVGSTLDDGSMAIAGLAFGGGPTQATSNTGTTIGAQNQLSWFSLNNKHRIKLTTDLRYERYSQDLTTTRLGTFMYNSLADLEGGRPAVFTRLLSPRVRNGDEVVAGMAFGDSYRPTKDVQIQYGVRFDGNRFLTSPSANPAVRQAFGVDNDVAPNRLYVSPRVGFSWTYGQAAQLAIANGFARGPRAVVRGGIGFFQGTPSAQLIGPAISSTGLPGSIQQLTCVGTAVPTPDWRSYLLDAGSIPSECADGTSGTGFASRAPNVALFDPSYVAPRSVRANLNWNGAVLRRFTATIDGMYSRNLKQAGLVDLNFNPATRFTLATEGGRPVYVLPGSIVPTTGAIAVQDARLSPDFAYVTQQRSNLESASRQLILGLRPLSFSTRFSWEVGYVYAKTRDMVTGFASTAGDPRVREWARSPFDTRHQVVYNLSYNFFDWFPVSISGWFRSGRPFTPLVAGDVNGDGYANDRAFVFDPATSSLDPVAASGLKALLESGSPAARACLAKQLGQLARRNSCESPWSSSSNLNIAINPLKLRLPQRLNVSLFVNNALGAADLLLHGENKRRGWGQTITPDQSLLFVRGFDPSTQRFRYEVNPRFGATRLTQTLNRNPVVVTAMVRIDVGLPRERQLLTRSLNQGRVREGAKATDQELRGMSGALIPPNPMALALQQADSLDLTRKQADSLAVLNRAYTIRLDSIWTSVAKFLATLPDGYDRADAYRRYRQARQVTVDMLITIVPSVRGLLTPQQLRKLPPFIMSSLDTRYLAFVRSSTIGGANMGILGMLAQMNAMGSASVDAGTVMIHR